MTVVLGLMEGFEEAVMHVYQFYWNQKRQSRVESVNLRKSPELGTTPKFCYVNQVASRSSSRE